MHKENEEEEDRKCCQVAYDVLIKDGVAITSPQNSKFNSERRDRHGGRNEPDG